MNYYEILGVPYGATKDEIKRAFHKLAHLHHPDKGGDGEKFKQISNAYAQLSKTAPEKSHVDTAPKEDRYAYKTRYSYKTYTNHNFTSENISDFADFINKTYAQQMADLERQQREMEEMLRRMSQKPFGNDYTM